MSRILEDLYFGEFLPSIHNYDDSEYCRALARSDELEEELNQLLEGRDKQMFVEYQNIQGVILATIGLHTFMDGVKLGARFILDIS